MREIKFRGWDEANNKMFKVRSMSWLTGGLEVSGGASTKGRFARGDIVKVMQYTGLKDKTDREIYEGDIVSTVTEKESVTHTVTFRDGAFWWGEAPMNIIYRLGGADNSILEKHEVIGNIYEGEVSRRYPQGKEKKE